MMSIGSSNHNHPNPPRRESGYGTLLYLQIDISHKIYSFYKMSLCDISVNIIHTATCFDAGCRSFKTMSKSPWIIVLILIVWLAAAQFPETSISSQKAIQWKNFSTGMTEAQKAGKPVFLHFYAVWCAYCAKMEKESFQNDTVIDFLNQNYISIRVDVDKQPDIAQNYNVFALPTTYFFSAKGEKLGPVPGYISRKRLLDMLTKV